MDLRIHTSSVISTVPKLTVQVYQADDLSRHELTGYGFCHLPMVSGTHDIEIVCWRPFGTWYERLSSKFIGGYPRLIQDRLACFDGSLDKDQFITLF
mmetsp:Transcript_23049/g.79290  ORF Transcript_23049/g.79290 Transcript_23049/m.79290 type:complete len:97 (+) Transcript_23049:197-487(+)